MTGFPRRPLALFVCCMFAGVPAVQAATDPVSDPLPSGDAASAAPSPFSGDWPVRLRFERKFNVLGKTRQQPIEVVGIQHPKALKKGDSYPLFVIADVIKGQAERVTEAEGNAEMRKADLLIFGDKLTHWPLEDEIEAVGNVHLFQEGVELETPYLRMKVAEQVGHAGETDYHAIKDVENKFYQLQQTVVTVASSNAVSTGAPMMLNVPNGYGLPTTTALRRPSEASGHAEHTEFEGENRISLTQATYSTCKPGQNDWYMQASNIHLDYEYDVGDARNASLWFKGVPIFYTPVATFSLNREAHSGFLHPHFSASTKNGFDFNVPYYWAIAPNYDVTFFPRYMAKRGFQLGAEAQYIDSYTRHTTRLEYVPKDDVTQRERYAYNIMHTQNLGRGFSGAVNWNGVSDGLYWQDMTSRLMQTSQTQLPRQLMLSYAPLPWLSTAVQMLHYQTLQPDPANPIARPYFLDPQFTVVGYKPNVLKTDLSLIGQYTRFTHPTLPDGDRFVFYPQASMPYVTPALQITPKIGLHMSKYALAQQAAGEPTSVTRILPTFSLDSTVVFEREEKLFGREYIQTLEPRLYYLNIPYKDQSRIPVFDSGLTDFNFAQMFSENRYSGFDRINDANQLTAAVTTRLLDANTGVERIKAMIGQRYYFRPQQVVLPGETARGADFSHIVAAVNGLILPKTYADAAWEYNNSRSTSDRFSLGMRYQPELGKVISAGYRYTRDPLTTQSTVDQVDLAGQWPISARWYMVGRYNYSMRDSKVLETIGGLEYNSGCWAVRAVLQRLGATVGAANTTLFFQLELSDFGSIGSNPLGLLRRTIPGYGKTNELPHSGSLLTTP